MKKLGLILTLAVSMSASVAFAQPYDPTMAVDGYDATPDAVATPDESSAAGNPQVYQVINQLLGTGLTSNGDTDAYQFTAPNTFWQDLGGGPTDPRFAAISLTASNSNTLQVYDSTNPADIHTVITNGPFFGFLGDGTALNPYKAGLNPFSSGPDFGFLLKSTGGGVTTVWDSDPANNVDSLDHMLVYYLPQLNGTTYKVKIGNGPVTDMTLTQDTYLIAWEDLAVNAPRYDADYNDTVFLVTRIRPVPEPMSMVLLGSGLLGLVGVRRRKS